MAKADIEVTVAFKDIVYDEVIVFFDKKICEYARNAEAMHTQSSKDMWHDMAVTAANIKFDFMKEFGDV